MDPPPFAVVSPGPTAPRPWVLVMARWTSSVNNNLVYHQFTYLCVGGGGRGSTTQTARPIHTKRQTEGQRQTDTNSASTSAFHWWKGIRITHGSIWHLITTPDTTETSSEQRPSLNWEQFKPFHLWFLSGNNLIWPVGEDVLSEQCFVNIIYSEEAKR